MPSILFVNRKGQNVMSIEQTATTRRVTRPRLLITQVLAELSRFATAQEITDILRERGTRIGTATAYRNV